MVALASLSLIIVVRPVMALWGILVYISDHKHELFVVSTPFWCPHISCVHWLFIVLGKNGKGIDSGSVVQDDQPAKVKGLVLFLSPPGQDTDLIQQIIDGKAASGISDKHLRESFSWCLAHARGGNLLSS